MSDYTPRHARPARMRRANRRELANRAEIVMAVAAVLGLLSPRIEQAIGPTQPVVYVEKVIVTVHCQVQSPLP